MFFTQLSWNIYIRKSQKMQEPRKGNEFKDELISDHLLKTWIQRLIKKRRRKIEKARTTEKERGIKIVQFLSLFFQFLVSLFVHQRFFLLFSLPNSWIIWISLILFFGFHSLILSEWEDDFSDPRIQQKQASPPRVGSSRKKKSLS